MAGLATLLNSGGGSSRGRRRSSNTAIELKDTGTPYSAGEATEYLSDTRKKASTALSSLTGLSTEERQRLNEIALKGFEGQGGGLGGAIGTGFTSLLKGLDSLRRTALLGLKDIGGMDRGTFLDTAHPDREEITFSDYWKALSGDTEGLVASLGPDIAGQHGDVSASSFFSQLGWDKGEGPFGPANDFVRGAASLTADVLTDPLTYVLPGMFLSKQATVTAAQDVVLGAFTSKVDDAVRVALKAGTNVSPAGMGRLESVAAGLVKTKADDVMGRLMSLNPLPAGASVADAARYLDDTIAEAVKLARDGARLDLDAIGLPKLISAKDDMVTPIVQSVVDRKWASLPSWWHEADEVPNMLKGGFRVSATPVFTQKSIVKAKAIPGTVGLGGAIKEATFGRIAGILDEVSPGLTNTWRHWASRFDTEVPILRAARDGTFYQVSRASDEKLKMALLHKYMIAAQGNNSMIGKLRLFLSSKYALKDDALRQIDDYLMDSLNSGQMVPPTQLHAMGLGSDAVDLFNDTVASMRKSLDDMLEVARPHMRGIEFRPDYVPMRYSDEFVKLVRTQGETVLLTVPESPALREALAKRLTAALGEPVSVDDIEAYAAALDDLAGRILTPPQVGQTIHQRTRNLGRTVKKGDTPEWMWVREPRLLRTARTYASQRQVDDAVMKVLRGQEALEGIDLKLTVRQPTREIAEGAVAKLPRKTPRKVDRPLRVFDDDPVRVLNLYTQDMMTKTYQAAMVRRLERAGLIKPATYREAVDRALWDIQPEFDAAADIVERIVAGRGEVIREITERSEKLRKVRIGQAGWVELPEMVATDPKVVSAVRAANEALKKAQGRGLEVMAWGKRLTNDLKAQGLSDETAQLLVWGAHAPLEQVRHVLRMRAEDMAVALEQDITRAVQYASDATLDEAIMRFEQVRAAAHSVLEGAERALKQFDEAARSQFDAPMRRNFPLSAPLVNGTVDAEHTLRSLRAVADTVEQSLERSWDVRIGALDDDIARIESQVQELVDASLPVPTALDRRLENAMMRRQVFEDIRHGRPAAVADGLLEGDAVLSREGATKVAEQFNKFVDAAETAGFDGPRKIQRARRMLGEVRADPQLFHVSNVGGHLADGAFDDEWVREVVAHGMVAEGVSPSLEDALGRIDRVVSTARHTMLVGMQTAEDSVREVLMYRDVFAALRTGDMERLASRTTQVDDLLRRTLGIDGTFRVQKDRAGNWHVWVETMTDADLPPMKDLAAKYRAGALSDADLGDYMLPEVERWVELDDAVREAKRSYSQARARQGRAVDRAERIPAEDAWDRLGPKLEAVFARKRGSVKRLHNVVYTRHGGLSKEWRDLIGVLEPDVADRLSRQVEWLFAADEAVTPVQQGFITQRAALYDGTLFDKYAESARKLEQIADDIRAERLTEAVGEQQAVIDTAEQFLADITGLKRHAWPMDATGNPTDAVRGAPTGGTRFDDTHPQVRQDIAAAKEAMNNVLAAQKGVKTLRVPGAKLRASEAKRFKRAFEPKDVNRVRVTQEGMVQSRSVGLSGMLEEVDINEVAAVIFENMVANNRALYTSWGVEQLVSGMRSAEGWWKSSATIRRPSFHIRNLVSAVYNNMYGGVGVKNYANARHVLTMRKIAQDLGGMTDEVWTRMVSEGVPPDMVHRISEAWREGVFDTAFSATFAHNVYNPARPKWLNVLSGEHVTTKWGAHAMQGIEDFARFAAFDAWYAEGKGATAAAVAKMLHFDYANLTSIERGLKKVVPFLVWTRRNIPLQLRMLMERPAIVNTYTHMMSAVRDNFGEDYDPYPHSSFLSPLAVDTEWVLNENTPFWARMVFDPDIPVRDLSELPGLNGSNPFNPLEWLSFGAGLVGPAYSTGLRWMEQQDYPEKNAPVGLNEMLRLANFVDNAVGAGLIDESPQGDVRVPYVARGLAETFVPFMSEFTAPFENDPDRAAKLGIDPAQGIGEDIAQRLGAGVVRTVGRGLGFQQETPSDTKSVAFQAQDFIDELKRRSQYQLK